MKESRIELLAQVYERCKELNLSLNVQINDGVYTLTEKEIENVHIYRDSIRFNVLDYTSRDLFRGVVITEYNLVAYAVFYQYTFPKLEKKEEEKVTKDYGHLRVIK